MAKAVKDQAKPLTSKQKKFLEVLESKTGNVTQACKALDTSRQTFYRWCDESDAFKKGAEDVQEGLLDMAESQLHMNILDGKEASIFFLLKTKGKSRGYVEKQEIDFQGEAAITNLKIEYVNKRD